jgi:multiple sugar transport system ATP-binding protein
MATIRLDGIMKQYAGPGGPITAVDDLDLTVENEEFLVLVGPSGCGKSTTLRSVAGLETVDGGHILIDDRDVTAEPPRSREIAMVFQNYALYPHKTVEGNMAYGLRKSTTLSDEAINERVVEFATMMGIDDLLDKRPGQLSGGQKQRTALGRALVRDPDAFLMDEPLSNLDAQLRLHMRTEIQQLQADLGVTTIYVTHDQEEAMTMGDRVVVMKEGRIQQAGSPESIYDRPANRFVAEFIGQPNMNFLPVTVETGRVSDDCFGLDLASNADVPDGRYVLGIRPEDIVLADAAEPGTAQADVAVTEPTGSDVVIYLDSDEEITIKTARNDVPSGTETMTFTIPEEKTYLFDPNTGETVYYGQHKRERAPIAESKPGV